MTVRSASIKSLLGLLLLALAGGAYLYLLSPSERWLFFWGEEAQTYAAAKLENSSIPKEMSDDFIEVLTITNPKERTVLFSPHDNHDIALVYAPDNPSESLVYEHTTAKRIRKNWYALP
jgi:hypothetical protein